MRLTDENGSLKQNILGANAAHGVSKTGLKVGLVETDFCLDICGFKILSIISESNQKLIKLICVLC